MKNLLLTCLALSSAVICQSQSLCFDPANDNRYDTYETCMDVGVTDINNDGHLDIIASGGSLVSIHLGQGDGTFNAYYTSLPGTNWDIEMVDFDGDDDLDFYSYGFGNVVAGRNLGNGLFEWAGYDGTSMVNNQFSEMTVGNIDDDPQPEIIVNDIGDALYIFQTDADGIPFESSTLYGTLVNPSNVKIGDLNGDNFMDLAVTSSSSSDIAICLSNGDGTFDITIQNANIVVSSGYATIEIADMDGDEDNDIMAGGAGEMHIIENNGNGTFTSWPDVFMGSYCQGFITGDWDGDGDNDVAWANQTSGGITVNLNNGDGSFPAQGNVFYSSGGQSEELVSGDFDEDGILDIVVANGFDGNFAFLKGNGDGKFGSLFLLAGYGAAGLCAADFDNNGSIDIIATNRTAPQYMALSRNNGDGSFQDTEFLPTVTNAEECVSGDFNEDGNADVAIHSSQGFHIHLGNGNGTFQDYVTYVSANIGEGGDRTICTGDFDGDGKLDLAGSRLAANNVAVVYGNGDGTFGAPDVYEDGIDYARTIIAAHLSNDAYEDIVICSNADDKVFVYFSNATEDLDAPLILSTPGQPEGLDVADYNEDGANDLIVVAPNANKCYFFAGNNDQTFDAPTEFDIPQFSNATRGSHGDINGDGHEDFICALYQDDAVAIFFGNGDGTFQSAVTYDVDRQPNRVITADFNDDGALDFSTLNSGIFNVSVVLNNSAFIVADGELAFCEGGDVVLTASEGSSYEWNNGATTQSITVNEGGEYYCAVTNQSGNCTLITTTVQVEVYQGQTVMLDMDSTLVCIEGGSFALSGGTPFGGLYSGEGVAGNVFDPAATGPGFFTITYTYADPGDCTNGSASGEIEVEVCNFVSEHTLEAEVYPTITEGFVTINAMLPCTYQLFDVNGRLMQAATGRNKYHTLDMTALSNGFYLLNIISEGESRVVKVEKVN